MNMPGHWRVMIVSHVLRQVLLLDPFGDASEPYGFTVDEIDSVQNSYIGYILLSKNMKLIIASGCVGKGARTSRDQRASVIQHAKLAISGQLLANIRIFIDKYLEMPHCCFYSPNMTPFSVAPNK